MPTRTSDSAPGSRPPRSRCPVSRALDVIGDRWSLLIVRDLARGKHRFAEFIDSTDGIPTNILADRLKRLVAAGIIKATRYSERPPRLEYTLTPKGDDLRSVIRTLAEWGLAHAGGRLPPDVLRRMRARQQDESGS